MPDPTKHECRESRGHGIFVDAGFGGDQVQIELHADGAWKCANSDACLTVIFCPFCGEKLPAAAPEASAREQGATG